MNDSIEKQKKVLCLGNISVDIKAYSPEDSETEAYRDGTIELVPGGVGRGMAINLKHLGLDTYIFAYVGNDIFGSYLRTGLEAEKVNLSLFRTSKNYETALFSVMASPGKPASCVYNTNIVREITIDEEALDVIRTQEIKTFVLDSNLAPETLEAVYDLKKNDPDLFVFQNATAPDIARKSLKFAPLIDLFACNEYEAAAILGQEVLPDLSTADKLQELGLKNFIITFGSKGVLVRIGKDTWIEPPYVPPQIVDTIGAGDAFASGFLMGFLENEPVKNCIHYGLVCAKETLLTRQTVSSLLSRSFLKNYKE